MSDQLDVSEPTRAGVNRRWFLQSSGGAATGLAAMSVPAAAVALDLPAAANANATPLGKRVRPVGDVPAETVMAYVHDAEKAHVTVVSGTVARTYHDPTLAKRLLDAARAQSA